MRSNLALAMLVSLVSASARAELVQLQLTGQVSSISGPANASYSSYAGISVGQTIQTFLRYDTPFLGDRAEHPTGPGGPGLTLVINGKQFGPAGTVSAFFHTNGPPPPGGIATNPWAWFAIGNGLAPNLGLNQPSASLALIDPRFKLLPAAAPAGYYPLPGSAAWASYGPQVDAPQWAGQGLYLYFTAEDGHSPITVTITPGTLAVNQTAEPSSVTLLCLGGLSLAGYRRLRRRALATV